MSSGNSNCDAGARSDLPKPQESWTVNWFCRLFYSRGTENGNYDGRSFPTRGPRGSVVNKIPSHQMTTSSVVSKMGDVTTAEYHKHFMREAIEMAELALRTDETPVGCVFVRNGEIIGRGMNDTNKSLNGTRHAEFVAIAQILQKYPPSILRETELYVTVEPCIMCASALRQFGIRAVYFGCFNDRFGGNGGVLRINDDDAVDPPYDAEPGIYREEAIMLLRRFYIQENEKAPEPKQKKTRELKTDILPLDLTKTKGHE